MDIQDYELQAEQMSEELMREGLLTGTGQKETYEITPIYDKYSSLFARDEVLRRINGREDERTANLANFAVEGYIGLCLKEQSEKLVNDEMAMEVELDGNNVPYRSAPIAIQNETDRPRRIRWEAAYVQSIDKLNPLMKETWQESYQVTHELGFTTYRDMCNQLGRLRLEWLLDSARSILDATTSGWQERVEQVLSTVGATADDGTTADISHYFRARQYDSAFPADTLIPSLKATLHDMGIDMDAQENLKLDLEDRPLKSPRAFCAPVRIPDEVWLVIKPHGGQDDYNSLLHEAGHAEHFTHTDPALPYALRGLGDTSVTETYAFLFNNLMFNEAWLNRHLGKRDWRPFLEFNRFVETWMLRRYCAKLLYEWELHSGENIDAPSTYSRILGEHLGVRIAPERYLADVDESFYVAQYLRAWHLEAQLRQKLETVHGLEWFANIDAGEHLKWLWSMGESVNAWDLAVELGFDGLDPASLIRYLTTPVN